MNAMPAQKMTKRMRQRQSMQPRRPSFIGWSGPSVDALASPTLLPEQQPIVAPAPDARNSQLQSAR